MMEFGDYALMPILGPVWVQLYSCLQSCVIDFIMIGLIQIISDFTQVIIKCMKNLTEMHL